MKFFFDNCISPHIASGISALSEKRGYEVIALRDRFDASTSDEEWLMRLSQEGGWIVLSGDSKIYSNSQRRKVWSQARLTTFFWQRSWLRATFWEQAWRMVRWWPKIVSTAETFERGSGFSIPYASQGKLKPIKF